MDSTLACWAGGLGLIPAVGIIKKVGKKFRWFFSPSRHKVANLKNGPRHDNLRDLASPLSSYR